MRVVALQTFARFERDLKGAPVDVQQAVREALQLLLQDPIPSRLRIHALSGYRNPRILKIDVFSNHSWQITFEMKEEVAILRRLGRHKDIDERP